MATAKRWPSHVGGKIRKEYVAWGAMRARCLQNAPSYSKNAGAEKYLGMEIEESWIHPPDGFCNFMDEVGEAFPGAFLDRKDNSKGYVKGNVKWSTPTESTHNRTNTNFVTAYGETKPISVWAREYNISDNVLIKRIRRGEDPETVLSTANKRQKRGDPYLVTAHGKTMTITEWASETGLKQSCIANRVKAFGWSHERAVTEGVKPKQRFEFEGESLTLQELSKKTGVNSSLLYQRLVLMNWPVDRAVKERNRLG